MLNSSTKINIKYKCSVRQGLKRLKFTLSNLLQIHGHFPLCRINICADTHSHFTDIYSTTICSHSQKN